MGLDWGWQWLTGCGNRGKSDTHGVRKRGKIGGARGAEMGQNRRRTGRGEAAASGKIELSDGAARRLQRDEIGRSEATDHDGARGAETGQKRAKRGGGRGLQRGENGRAEGAGRARLAGRRGGRRGVMALR